MTNRKIYWVLILACLTLLFVVGCGQLQLGIDIPNEQAQEPEEDKTPSIEVQEDNKITISMRKPKSLHPILNTDKTVDQTLKLIFDTLVDFDENNQVVPHIAKSWAVSEQGTIVNIKLNNHIKWHDGTPLTAGDVVYTLDVIKDAPESPYKPCVENIFSYEALSDETIQIIYKEAFSGYATTLYFPIIPAHVENLDTNPVGTGPYIFETYLSTKQMNLRNNNGYFKGSPSISAIEVLFTHDAESDLYSFDQRIIDVVSTDVVDWEKYAKNKKSIIHEYTTMYYDYIGVNFNKPDLQDVKIRQALLYATNREYLLEKVYLYHGEVADVPVAPFSWLYEPTSKQYETNIQKAKELLEGKTITIELLVNGENIQRKEVASALQKMYKDVGINLEIIEEDAEVFMDRIINGQYDLFLGGWNFSIIPDMSFAFHSTNVVGGANYGGYVSSEMDSLLKEAFNAKSDEGLKVVYTKLQTHISKHLPYLSLYFRTAALITNEKIKGDIKPHHMNVYQNIHEWYIN